MIWSLFTGFVFCGMDIVYCNRICLLWHWLWLQYFSFLFTAVAGMTFVYRICLLWHGLGLQDLSYDKDLVDRICLSWHELCFLWHGLCLQDLSFLEWTLLGFVFPGMDFVLRNYLIQEFWLLSGILDFPYRISLSLIWYLFTRMLLTFFTGFAFAVIIVYKNAFDFLYRICLWCRICLQECIWLS